jgi:hypothetical protein
MSWEFLEIKNARGGEVHIFELQKKNVETKMKE